MGICTGQCPGFKTLDLWELVNAVRREMEVECALVLPSSMSMMGTGSLKIIFKMIGFISIGACDPKMQRKMMKDAFHEVGADFEKQVIPLDLRNMTTEDAINRVQEAIEAAK